MIVGSVRATTIPELLRRLFQSLTLFLPFIGFVAGYICCGVSQVLGAAQKQESTVPSASLHQQVLEKGQTTSGC